MKKLLLQLDTISKTLTTLSEQVEQISDNIKNRQSAKPPPDSKQKTAAEKKFPAKKTGIKKSSPTKPPTIVDTVFQVIKKSRKGVTTTILKEKTELGPRQITNALFKLTQQNRILAKT